MDTPSSLLTTEPEGHRLTDGISATTKVEVDLRSLEASQSPCLASNLELEQIVIRLHEKNNPSYVEGVKFQAACSALVQRGQTSASDNSERAIHPDSDSSREQQVPMDNYPVSPTPSEVKQMEGDGIFSVHGSCDPSLQAVVTLERKDRVRPKFGIEWDIDRSEKVQDRRDVALYGDLGGTDVSLSTDIDEEPGAQIIKGKHGLPRVGMRSLRRLSSDDAK